MAKLTVARLDPLAASLIAVSWLACGGAPQEVSPATHRALAAADRDLSHAAEERGLGDALAERLTGDALYLHAGAPLLHGESQIRAFLSRAGGARVSMKRVPLRVDVSRDGTRGYSYGWTETPSAAAGAGRRQARYGKYLAFWKRVQANWRIAAYVEVPTGVPPAPQRSVSVSPASAAAGWIDGTTAQGLEEVDAAFDATARLHGVARAFWTFAADDAASLSTGERIVVGRDSIRRSLEDFTGCLAWRPLFSDAAPSGDLGFTLGEAVAGSGTGTRYSHYLTVWKKQPSGDWRFVADGGVSRPAADRAGPGC